MCESDPFRRAGLARAWPGVPIVEDVREFRWPLADTMQKPCTEGCEQPVEGQSPLSSRSTQYAEDRPTLLTAGVPCQPASRAGKQRGQGDDRWLWGEAVRVLGEAQPRYAIFENPPGIEDVGLDRVLADVEAQGYEIGAILDIPACMAWATGFSPHRFLGFAVNC